MSAFRRFVRDVFPGPRVTVTLADIRDARRRPLTRNHNGRFVARSRIG